MTDSLIKVENLGKKYIISHVQQTGTYTALRDVISNATKSIFWKGEKRNSKEECWALKDISFEVDKVERLPSKTKITFQVKGDFSKTIDVVQVLTKIEGKQKVDAIKMLKNEFGVLEVQIIETPSIPPFNLFIPFFKRNIVIRVGI